MVRSLPAVRRPAAAARPGPAVPGGRLPRIRFARVPPPTLSPLRRLSITWALMLQVATIAAAMSGLFAGNDWQAWFAAPALGMLALLATLRLAGFPDWARPGIGLLVGASALFGLFGVGEGWMRFVPTRATFAHLREMLSQAGTLIAESSTPVAPTAELMMLLAAIAALLA
ncbi:MAG: hypothetical protein LBJ08_11555, partial [Bifidobacteriaceae bacterium]|nr:hypothetical protein [Bifidobacteriaceae bacterium]